VNCIVPPPFSFPFLPLYEGQSSADHHLFLDLGRSLLEVDALWQVFFDCMADLFRAEMYIPD